MHHRGFRGSAIFNGEAEARLFLVEALLARSAGVDEQHVAQGLHTLDLQDVAVPAHEKIRRVGAQFLAHAPLPPAGPPGDVRHPHVKPLDTEPLVLRDAPANRRIVDVSPYGRDRGHRLQSIQDCRVANVAGVQNPVHSRQVLGQTRVKIAVRIRHNAEGGHGRREIKTGNENCSGWGRREPQALQARGRTRKT